MLKASIYRCHNSDNEQLYKSRMFALAQGSIGTDYTWYQGSDYSSIRNFLTLWPQYSPNGPGTLFFKLLFYSCSQFDEQGCAINWLLRNIIASTLWPKQHRLKNKPITHFIIHIGWVIKPTMITYWSRLGKVIVWSVPWDHHIKIRVLNRSVLHNDNAGAWLSSAWL